VPPSGFRHLLLLAFTVCFAGAVAAVPQLDRDPSHYLVLGVRSVNLKNFSLRPPIVAISTETGRRAAPRAATSTTSPPPAVSRCRSLHVTRRIRGGAGRPGLRRRRRCPRSAWRR